MNILFLQKRLLYPTDTGGKIRTLNVLRHLAKSHRITYLSNLLPAEEPYVPQMEALGLEMVTIPWTEAPRGSAAFYLSLLKNVFSPYPFNVNKDFDPRLRAKVLELLETRSFDLLICDFVQMARNCLGIKKVPKLLFEHNVEAQIFRRHSLRDPGWLRRAYMWMQWKKMLRFEGRAGRDFDTVIAVSPQDREVYERDYGWDHVEVIDTSVDTSYFSRGTTPETPRSCVFTGSMDWLPNEDGVRYFVRSVWPIVRQRFPDATFTIVGRNPPASIQELDARDGIEVTGTVADVRPYIARSQISVIPLLVGGGTRLKAYEAMAMGKAIVSTSLGVEGLPLTDGTHIVLADTERAFAESIIQLFENDQKRKQISQNGFEMVRTRFHSARVARQFESICENTVAERRPAQQPQPVELK